ncbi:MAG TPA: tetratricopeptide repeat protein [Candidatus Dormibacteraeota bacterium]|nr:tetratricopeptide repeat protein [Candidatus Dormibacteraeota bacterium]
MTAEEVNGLVQGDHNTVTMNYSNYYGAVASPANAAAVTPVLTPASLLPAPCADLLDRVQTSSELTDAVRQKTLAELSGAQGIGKSSLLRSLCRQFDVSSFATGIAYIEQRGQPVEDLLQFLFDAFYTAPQPTKPVGAQLMRYLQGIQALVIVDDLTLTRDDADHLRNSAPNCTFVLASEQARMTEGVSVRLAGLPEAEGRQLLERRLRRALAADEQAPVRDLWTSVGGNPLLLVQAAALVDAGVVTFTTLAEKVRTGGPSQLGAEAVAACTPDEKHLLAMLAALGESPVPQEHVAAIAGQPGAAEMLRDLTERGLAQSHSPSFTAVASVTAALPASVASRVRDHVVDHVVDWAAGVPPRDDLLNGAPVIEHTIDTAVAAGRWSDVIALGRRIETGLANARRWAAWKAVLDRTLDAARRTGDGAQEGWALHQLGTRALGLEDFKGARSLLTRAVAVREAAGDTAGAAVSEQNLAVLRQLELVETLKQGEPPNKNGTPPGSGGGSPPWGLVAGATVIALLVATAGAVYALSPRPSNPQPSPRAQVAAPPVVSAANPSALGQGATARIDFTGSEFEQNMTVDLGQGITIASVIVNSSSSLTVDAAVAPDAATGARIVSLATKDGRRATCSTCLSINPAPVIERFAPHSARPGSDGRLVVIALHLTPNTQLSITGGGVYPKFVVDQQGNQIGGTITVDPTAQLGPRDVTLTNPDGGTSTCAGCFTVISSPVITTATPNYAYYSQTNSIKLTGAGLIAGATVTFPGSNMTVDKQTWVNSDEIDINVTPSANTPPGYQTLVVSNPDGGTSQCTNCLYVTTLIQ